MSTEEEFFPIWLLDRLDEVGDLFDDPGIEISKDEAVLGEMNDYLKRLYTVYNREYEQVNSRIETIMELCGGSSSLSDGQRNEIESLIPRFEILRHLFCYELDTFFGPISDEKLFGVRKGFRIITFEPSDSDIPEISMGIIAIESMNIRSAIELHRDDFKLGSINSN